MRHAVSAQQAFADSVGAFDGGVIGSDARVLLLAATDKAIALIDGFAAEQTRFIFANVANDGATNVRVHPRSVPSCRWASSCWHSPERGGPRR